MIERATILYDYTVRCRTCFTSKKIARSPCKFQPLFVYQFLFFPSCGQTFNHTFAKTNYKNKTCIITNPNIQGLKHNKLTGSYSCDMSVDQSSIDIPLPNIIKNEVANINDFQFSTTRYGDIFIVSHNSISKLKLKPIIPIQFSFEDNLQVIALPPDQRNYQRLKCVIMPETMFNHFCLSVPQEIYHQEVKNYVNSPSAPVSVFHKKFKKFDQIQKNQIIQNFLLQPIKNIQLYPKFKIEDLKIDLFNHTSWVQSFDLKDLIAFPKLVTKQYIQFPIHEITQIDVNSDLFAIYHDAVNAEKYTDSSDHSYTLNHLPIYLNLTNANTGLNLQHYKDSHPSNEVFDRKTWTGKVNYQEFSHQSLKAVVFLNKNNEIITCNNKLPVGYSNSKYNALNCSKINSIIKNKKFNFNLVGQINVDDDSYSSYLNVNDKDKEKEQDSFLCLPCKPYQDKNLNSNCLSLGNQACMFGSFCSQKEIKNRTATYRQTHSKKYRRKMQQLQQQRTRRDGNLIISSKHFSILKDSNAFLNAFRNQYDPFAMAEIEQENILMNQTAIKPERLDYKFLDEDDTYDYHSSEDFTSNFHNLQTREVNQLKQHHALERQATASLYGSCSWDIYDTPNDTTFQLFILQVLIVSLALVFFNFIFYIFYFLIKSINHSKQLNVHYKMVLCDGLSVISKYGNMKDEDGKIYNYVWTEDTRSEYRRIYWRRGFLVSFQICIHVTCVAMSLIHIQTSALP